MQHLHHLQVEFLAGLASVAWRQLRDVPCPCGTPAVFEYQGVSFIECPNSRNGGRVQFIGCSGRPYRVPM